MVNLILHMEVNVDQQLESSYYFYITRHVEIIKSLLIIHSIKPEENKLGEYEINAEDYTLVAYKTVKIILVF